MLVLLLVLCLQACSLRFAALPDPGAGLPDASSTAATAPKPQPSHANTLRLGSWNVRRLGFDDSTDITTLAGLVEAQFDLLGLLEVMQTGTGGHAGYDALLAELGPAWAGQITSRPRPDTNSPYSEFYAVVYRVSLVEPCADELQYAEDPDDSFLREPAFGCYRARFPAAHGSDFLLGVYHGHWGSGAADEIAREVSGIDAVLAQVHEAWPTEGDVLLAGDFNLTSSELEATIQAHDWTRGSGSTLGPSGAVTSHLYDHLLLLDPQQSTELAAPAEVLDLRQAAGGADYYVRHLSDHLPIRTRWKLVPDDD